MLASEAKFSKQLIFVLLSFQWKKTRRQKQAINQRQNRLVKSTTGENGASAEIEFCIVVLAVQNLAAAEVFIQENGKSKNHSSSSNAEAKLIFIIDLPFQKCQQLTQLFSGSLASEFSNLEVGSHHNVWKNSKMSHFHWPLRTQRSFEWNWPQQPLRSMRSISKRRFWWDFFVLFIHCAWTSLAHGTAF